MKNKFTKKKYIFLKLKQTHPKWLSWKWLKSKAKGFNYAFDQWNLNPLGCLGIVSAE
jgi:hypothetical protein